MQDCFLKWQAAEQARLATPAAWLTTVVQHQSIDRVRKRARDELAAQVAMELLPATAPVQPDERLLQNAELAEALARLLAWARRRLRDEALETTPQEKLCRELVRRFQAAINGMDVPAVVTLLADEQPVSVHTSLQPRMHAGPCANDAVYRLPLAA